MVARDGFVDRAGRIGEGDVIRSQQAVPMVAHLPASAEIDAIERQRVDGLVGRAVRDRQRDLMSGSGLGRWRLLHGTATEVHVEFRMRPRRVRLHNVVDPDLKPRDRASGAAKLCADAFLKTWRSLEDT